ncbi:hypothetical protein [Aquabacterium sp.]|uniref:hypothetical protein n=1 Tax=Aquabacterium sp. TaxID=1872578 RepID=UPI0025C1B669|nr:hypothetical protein [Aquabacterium sp.]
MARVLNTAAIRLAMQRMAPAMEAEMGGELDALAQLVARRMRQLAPKFRSLLAVGIRVDSPEPLVRDIGPTASYAAYQEDGIKPGGKGLPRYDDPASADVLAWLRTKVFSGRTPPRKNTMAAVRANLELRDRYEGLAWHIRHKGIKARPFVKPAFDQLEPVIRVRLQAAGERAVAQAGGTA